MVGRSPSRCALDGRVRFHYFSSPESATQPRQQRRGNRHGKVDGPAVLSLLFISCRGDDWIRDNSYGTGTVGCWFGSLQCRRRLTIWNGNRSNVVALFDPKPGLMAPLTQPSFASFVCSQTACRRDGACDEGLRCAGVFSNGRRSATVCRESTNGEVWALYSCILRKYKFMITDIYLITYLRVSSLYHSSRSCYSKKNSF